MPSKRRAKRRGKGISSNRQAKELGEGMPDSDPRGPSPGRGSAHSWAPSPGIKSGRLPNGPPPSQQLPKDTGSFSPLNQRNGARPQETDHILQPLTGLIDLPDSLNISLANINTRELGPVDSKLVGGDPFKTNADDGNKSGSRREQELVTRKSDFSDHPTVAFCTQGDGLTFDEVVHTPKLDRSGLGFEEREREAQRTPNEILATNNGYVRGERVMDNGGDNGTSEEEKYAGVVRGANKHIPPGARKADGSEDSPKPDIPEVLIDGSDGATPTPQASTSNGTIPAPSVSTGDATIPTFRDFIISEKQRLAQEMQRLIQEKQVVSRAERDKWAADFVKFSRSFKLKKPIPDDLVLILTKDEEKQKQIREKTKSDAVSENARAIRQATNNPLPPKVVRPTPMESATRPNAPIKWQNMIIQTIPPFKKKKFIQIIPPFKGKPSNPPPADGNASTAAKRLDSVSPDTTTGPSAANQSPKLEPTDTAKPHPFFGVPIEKTTTMHIEDDFSPFKYAMAAEPSAIETIWPYCGNRYSHDLPSQPPTTQQHSPHIAPPVFPPIPPPSCDGDSAEQNAVRYSSQVWALVPQSDLPAAASGPSENYDENLNLIVSSELQRDPGKHTVNADIRIGQCASPVLPIYLHDTALTTIPESACSRLIEHTLDPTELTSLIEAIFSSEEEARMTHLLCEGDAQTFVDVIHRALETLNLLPQIQKRCLKALCETCQRKAVLPNSLLLPLCYDRLGFPLHSGGFADVWKGKHNGQDVAVKVIRVPSYKDLPRITGKFCKEAVAWKALRHPNVLPLLGVIMNEFHLAMVSEWMENGNINDFVKENPEADRLGLLIGVARGLIYIHNQEMIHGDLKGANVLVDNAHNARIADFSLLTILSGSLNIFPSSSHTPGGTARWMSPELIDPERFGLETSRRTKLSDSYALGMVIYETISGHLPFHKHSDLTVFKKVLDDKRPLRGVGFTDSIWELLGKCWEPVPGARPSVEDILQCLEGVWNSSETPSAADEDSEGEDDDEDDDD